MATVPIPIQPFDPDDALACLQEMLGRGDVPTARQFVKQLEVRWPDPDRVRYYARVLAPPRTVSHQARTTPAHAIVPRSDALPLVARLST
jgi:hypothetical protein